MTAENVAAPAQDIAMHMEYIGQHRAAEMEAEAQRAGWRGRVAHIAGKTVLAAALTLGIGSAAEAVSAEPAAAAVGCYGDYCSGRYASDTGCDRDAQTIAQADVTQQDYRFGLPFVIEPGDAVKVGVIELRYSPTCKTKWARLSTYVRNGVSDVRVTQDTGYTQSRHIGGLSTGSPAARSNSPMIYSPNNAVHAYVTGGSGDLINTSTDWV